jgi:VWFA-related protein
MSFAFLFLTLAVLAQSAGTLPGPEADEPQEPLDVGLREQVDVQLVLVDFLVLDDRDRTVPDLTIDDFVLVVHGREMPIASLDLDCPGGSVEEPRPAAVQRDEPPPPAPSQPRRIVLVFDYFHMTNPTEALEYVHEGLGTWASEGDLHMVASLGNVVRIESPFTADVEEVRWTIQRMRNDPDLYAGNYSRLTETGWFGRVRMLFDLLEREPGRKSIVLFSGAFQPDGFYHDPAYKELSGLSAVVRTSIYPVDTAGLTLSHGILGPPMLRRLATETGGRMTASTNDIGLGYARAQRDLGCTYALGFYDDRPRHDRETRMTIRVRDREGLRIVYPEFYVIRSPEKKRESLFRTAAMMPQMFESEGIGLGLHVVGPHSPKRWKTVMVVDVPAALECAAGEEAAWDLRGLVRKPNGTVVHSFERRIPISPAGEGPLTLFQTIDVEAGDYVVSAVLSDPRGQTPLAATRLVTVPRIPHGEPFLVGPVLGRSAAVEDDAARRREERSQPEFEPLMDAEAEQGQPLQSLTLVCVVGTKETVDIRAVARVITSFEGRGAQTFAPVALELQPLPGGIHCEPVLDDVATSTLEPGRYEMAVIAETEDDVTGHGAIEFTIRPAAAR